ncbi:hypothetical protein JEQ12_019380 [Ovis aries]|uniref:Elongin-C n=1 Tax=Ovis aries TaxID=9940 RepID=A0A835ZYB3_SHEEP|nr:hypothetical protein JEQ12_019380 [Ovis aries]
MDGEEKTYGGCEGPDAMYVKLISSDGHEFIVKREHALTSGTIKAMLSGPGQFAENETNEVNFREIPSHVLSKVCMYFTYKGYEKPSGSVKNRKQPSRKFHLAQSCESGHGGVERKYERSLFMCNFLREAFLDDPVQDSPRIPGICSAP